MQKRGQMEISFGVIFSIIIIIAIIGTGIYVLSFFMNTKECTEVGMFYDGLQNAIDEAWNSEITNTKYTSKALPPGVEKVCFGNVSEGVESGSKKEYEAIRFYGASGKNVYLYPLEKACDKDNADYLAKHLQSDKFFCVSTKNNKAVVRISKGQAESLVKLSAQ